MKNKATIQQQILATCLLSVFLLITVAKLFHTHGANGHPAHSSYIEQVAKGGDCQICDYHFTKDTDHLTHVFTPAKPLALPSRNISYESRIASSIGLSYSDRGPPAII